MNGIDTFLDLYSSSEVLMTAKAFRAVGAEEIAKCLEPIVARLPERTEAELSRANDLITSMAGYDYEAIEHMVASHIGE